MREEALGLLDNVAAADGNLHGEDAAEDVEGGVGDVESVGVAACVRKGEEAYG